MKKVLLATLFFCTPLLCQEMRQIADNSSYDTFTSENDPHDTSDSQTQEEETLLDYEYHVCDSIKPAKTSYITALLTNVGCTLLIQYITLKEKSKKYMLKVKHTLEKLYGYMRALLL